jgi:hypothetical protein
MTILHNVRMPLTDGSHLQVAAFDHGRAIISGEGLTHSWSSYIPIAKCREYGAALIAAADAYDAHVEQKNQLEIVA